MTSLLPVALLLCNACTHVPLFVREPPARLINPECPANYIIRSRTVRLNRRALSTNTRTVTVNLFDDVEYTFNRNDFHDSGDDIAVLARDITGAKFLGRITMSVSDAGARATVHFDGRVYLVYPTKQDVMRIDEINQHSAPHDPDGPNRYHIAFGDCASSLQRCDSPPQPATIALLVLLPQQSNDPYFDLVCNDQSLLSLEQRHLQAHMTMAWTLLGQPMGVTPSVNVVCTDYKPIGDQFHSDLRWLKTNITNLQKTYAADLVTLMVPSALTCGGGVSCNNPGLQSNLAGSVINWLWATSIFGWAHEVGHTLGMDHDRGTLATSENDQACNFGYRSDRYHTIMAYPKDKPVIGTYSSGEVINGLILGVSCEATPDPEGYRRASNITQLQRAAPCAAKFSTQAIP